MATIVLQTEGVDSRHRQQMETDAAYRRSHVPLARRPPRFAADIKAPAAPTQRPSQSLETVVPRVRISRDAPSSTSDCHHAVAWHALITPLQAPLGQVPNLVPLVLAVLRRQPLLDGGHLAEYATRDVARVAHETRNRLQHG